MVDAAIVGLALKDPQNLEAALRIGTSFDEIRRNVASIFLRCVQERLVEWVLQQGEDWEVVVKWDGGNWVEQPGKKWLPLLLRKRAWPELVGVAIQAEEPGPCKVFIGICGPTQDFLERDGQRKYTVVWRTEQIHWTREQTTNRKGDGPESAAK